MITIRDSNGRASTVSGRTISLASGTYILEARAPGYDSAEQAIIVSGRAGRSAGRWSLVSLQER